MIRGGPRIALEKIKRKELHCLLLIRIVILFLDFFTHIFRSQKMKITIE